MRKIHNLRSVLFASTLVISFIALQPAVYAKCSTCDVVKAVNKLDQNVTTISKNATKEKAKLLYQPNSFAAGTQATNNVQISTVEPAANETATLSAQNYLKALLTASNEAKFIQKYASLCGSDFTADCSKQHSIFGGGGKKTTIPENASFSASSLLNHNNYTAQQQLAAKNFISFVSGTTIPFTSGEGPNPNKNPNANTPKMQRYRVELRNYMAALSAGLDQLFYIYSQHTPAQKTSSQNNVQKIDLTTVGLPKKINGRDTQHLSPDALDKIMATRRISGNNSHKWFKSVSTASPTKLQRMTVELLAEVRYELYQQHMLQERQLAVASALELQITQETQQLNLTRSKSAIFIAPIQQKLQKEKMKELELKEKTKQS